MMVYLICWTFQGFNSYNNGFTGEGTKERSRLQRKHALRYVIVAFQYLNWSSCKATCTMELFSVAYVLQYLHYGTMPAWAAVVWARLSHIDYQNLGTLR
jgi:hypothetical protein